MSNALRFAVAILLCAFCLPAQTTAPDESPKPVVGQLSVKGTVNPAFKAVLQFTLASDSIPNDIHGLSVSYHFSRPSALPESSFRLSYFRARD